MPQWGWRRRTGGGKNYGLHSASIIHYVLSIRCRGELRSNVRQTFGMCYPACVPFLETFFARSTAIDDLECISDIGFIPLLQCMTQTKHALHRFWRSTDFCLQTGISSLPWKSCFCFLLVTWFLTYKVYLIQLSNEVFFLDQMIKKSSQNYKNVSNTWFVLTFLNRHTV